MDIVSKLTDKPDWHRKVFDETIVANWKKEAMAVPDEVWATAAAAPGSDWDPSVKKRRLDRGEMERKIPNVISEQVWDYVSALSSPLRYLDNG